ncbi:hypothetical protein CY35_18G076000 [Sphagnum magellanicum]|nr:hypothetical protein CY35_18G076000 [Sphagnum magellanicum]
MQPLLCSSLLPASSFVAYGCQLLPTTGLNVQPSLLYSTGRPANSVVAVRALFGVGSKPKAVRQVKAVPSAKTKVQWNVRAAREQERTRKMATCLSAGNVMIVKALDS